jgi:hypothetical protein
MKIASDFLDVTPFSLWVTFRTNLISQYFTLRMAAWSFTEASANLYHYSWTFKTLKIRPLVCRNVGYQPSSDAASSPRRTETSTALLWDHTKSHIIEWYKILPVRYFLLNCAVSSQNTLQGLWNFATLSLWHCKPHHRNRSEDGKQKERIKRPYTSYIAGWQQLGSRFKLRQALMDLTMRNVISFNHTLMKGKWLLLTDWTRHCMQERRCVRNKGRHV